MINEFVDILKEKLINNPKKIQVIGQISGLNYGFLNLNCLSGAYLDVNSPIQDVKFRFQSLISGANFTPGNYRLDNCHNWPIHQHSISGSNLVEIETLGGALSHILGSEVIEFLSFKSSNGLLT